MPHEGRTQRTDALSKRPTKITAYSMNLPKLQAGLLAGTLLVSGLVAANNPFITPPAPGETLAAVSRATQNLHAGIPVPVEVVPAPSQVQAARLITYFLETFHYHKVPLDDSLSAAILERYLDHLDPGHAFFMAADVASFQDYKHQLDDELKQTDLSIPFAIFNVYMARVEERADYALGLLDEDFDFTSEASYNLDRSESPWPEDSKAANALWRKRVKNDILSLKLTGKDKEEIRETLRKRYESLAERVSELDKQDAFQLFMNAYAGAIEPHTSYLSPRTSENFEIAMSLSLEGIGAVLQRDFEYTMIRRIVTGGPADKEGHLQADDRIVGVAQGKEGSMVDVIGWRLDDVVQLIRGPKGSIVRLAILPAGEGIKGPPEVVQITRNTVELEEQSAEKKIIPIQANGKTFEIGVIDVPTFYIDFAARAQGDDDYRSTTRDVRELLSQLKEEQVDGVVIDLRGNGGGSLLEAISLTGLFIDQGPVVQVRSASGNVNVESDTDSGLAWDGPLAVMVDRYSASASEIFAGAIQDYGRGVLIGEPTYGKGTVQNLIDLDQFNNSDDSARMGKLKITTAKFFRVNGNSTQNHGVTPDIVYATKVDPEETGESSHENALPWSAIEPADYDPSQRLEDVLAKAAAMHVARVADNKAFQAKIADINDFYADHEDTVVSLQLAKRQVEFEAAEADRDDRFDEDQSKTQEVAEAAAEGEGEPGAKDEKSKENEEEEEKPDVLLKEAAHILADIVRLKQPGHLMRAASIEGEETKESEIPPSQN